MEHAGAPDRLHVHPLVRRQQPERGFRDDDFASYMAISEMTRGHAQRHRRHDPRDDLRAEATELARFPIAVDEWNVWYRASTRTHVHHRHRLRHRVRQRAAGPHQRRRRDRHGRPPLRRRRHRRTTPRQRHAPCRPTGPSRTPTTTSRSSNARSPRCCASGVDPTDVVGIGIDFTACTMLPTLGDGTPLCRLPELRDEPHAWVKLWKHHAAQPHADRINDTARQRGRALARALRRQDLQRVVLQQGPADPRRGARGLPRADRLIEAADWIVWQLTGTRPATPAPPATRPCTRTATSPPATTSPPSTPTSPTSSTRRCRASCCPWARGRRPQRGGGALDRGCARHAGRRRQRRRARHPARDRHRRARHHGHDHGHLHLQRARRRRRSTRSRACAAWSWAASSPANTATRPARAASATSSPGSSTTPCRRARTRPRPGLDLHGYLAQRRPPATARRTRPPRPRLVERQPQRARRRRTRRPAHRHDPRHPPRGHLPRPPRGHRLRQRVIIEGFEAPACPVTTLVAAGGLPARTRSSCRSTPTSWPRHPPRRQRPGPRPRLRHARRRGRRRLPRHRRRRRAHGRPQRRRLPAPSPSTSRAYDELYRDYLYLHDLFGRAGRDQPGGVMKRLRERRAQARHAKGRDPRTLAPVRLAAPVRPGPARGGRGQRAARRGGARRGHGHPAPGPLQGRPHDAGRDPRPAWRPTPMRVAPA
jgi:hypothetical protein